MSNPFDQFDAPANPFDQFDAPSTPAARPGLGERFVVNATQGFREGTLAGKVLSDIEMGKPQRTFANIADQAMEEARASGSNAGLKLLSDGRLSPYYGVPLDRISGEREKADEASRLKLEQFGREEAARQARAAALPAWSGPLEGATALAGQVLGSSASPESLVPAARGRTIAETFARGGLVNSATTAAAEPIIQQGNIEIGRQAGPDLAQAAASTVLGGLVGGVANAIPHALGNAFRAWRAKNGVAPDTIDLPPMPEEAAIFMRSPEGQAAAAANGIADAADPRAAVLAEKLQARRAAEAERAQRPIDTDPQQIQAEKDAIASGELDPAAAAAVSARRAPTPEVIVPERAIDPSVQAGVDLRGRTNLPAVTEPQPTRMTPEEVSRAQRQNAAGNPNRAEPVDTPAAPPDRAPQTRDDMQGQREAGQAFDLAARQRERVAPDVRDTQTAGRPEGVAAKTIALDDGFPVEIVERRMVPDAKGNMVEVAKVRRYDPRTGTADADAVEYEVPVRQLKRSNYATEPRRAQDFVDQSQSPRNPETPRAPDEPVAREPGQTYRATAEDPNTDFPGAGPGRSPIPDQPPGEAPGRRWSRAEDAARDFADRQARGEQSRAWSREEAKANAGKSSSKAADPDADGRFATDEGFVRSNKGGPVSFADQMQAAKWILNVGQKGSPDQIFEIANHPGGKGFTVRERGRSDPPPSGAKPKPEQPAAAPAEPRALPAPERPAAPPVQPAATQAPAAPTKATQRVPSAPQSLIQWIRAAGGMQDPGGDVRSMAGDARSRPGLVSNTGMDPDTMAARAWEQGYLGGKGRTDRPTINELFDAINEDLRGNRQYSDADQSAAIERDAALRNNAEVERLADELGLDARTATREEIQGAINERLSQEEQYARLREIDDAIASEHADAEARTREIAEERGDAWEPEYTREDVGGDAGRGQGARDAGSAGRSEGEVAGDTGQGRAGDAVRDRAEPAARDDAGRADKATDDVGRDQGLKTEKVSTADGPRDQGVMPGMDRSAKQAQAARDTKRGLASDAPQKAADEGLFKPEPAKGQGSMTLGAFGTPETWAKVFGWPIERAKAWISHSRDMAGTLKEAAETGKADPVVRNFARMLALPADSWIRSVAKEFKSPTLDAVINKIHARAADDAGVAVGRTWHEAVSGSVEKRIGQLEKSIGKIMGDKAAMAQLVRLVQNPGTIKPGTPLHDAAAGVTKLLRDMHAYMREAGVEVGEIKNGYFPRQTDMAAVARDPQGFVAAAKKEFMRLGASAKDAEEKAIEWQTAVLFEKNQASPFNAAGGDAFANFLKGRTLSKQADETMRKYLVQDPAQVLTGYISSAVRRAETARRFGDRWKDWAATEEKIQKEGAGGSLEALRNYVATATGVKPPGAPPAALKVLSGLRTWTTLGTLESATIASLSEPILSAVRSGNVIDLGRSLKRTVQAVMKSQGSDVRRLREIGEDIGAISSAFNHNLMAERWAGGDPQSKFENKVLSTFFTRTYLEQWTNATREGSVSVGETFLRRLSKDAASGRTPGLVARSLSELGIPTDKVPAFSKWLSSTKDGRPELADLKGEMGELYKTALFRFVDQSIMRPNASTRPTWASHPLGRVVFQLQSFQYAFAANVLGRAGRRVFDAVDPRSALTGFERAKLASQVIVPLALYTAAQTGLSMGRDAVRGDPVKKKEEKPYEATLRHLSRAGLTGYSDPLLNAITGARYGRDPATTLIGPTFSRWLDGLKVGSDLALRNTDKTNTQERAAARWVYDLLFEPAVNMALSVAAPGSSLVAAGVTQAVGSGRTREAAISAIAGPKAETGRGGGRASSR